MALWPEALKNNNNNNNINNNNINNNVNKNTNEDDACLKLVLKYFSFDDPTLSKNNRFSKIKSCFKQLSDWSDASTDVNSAEALMDVVLKIASNQKDMKRCIMLICSIKGSIWTINHAIVNVLWDALSRWVQTIDTPPNDELQAPPCDKTSKNASNDEPRGDLGSKTPINSAEEDRVCAIIDLLGVLSSRHHREVPEESMQMLLSAMHALMSHGHVSMVVREAALRSLVRMVAAKEEEEEDGDDDGCVFNDDDNEVDGGAINPSVGHNVDDEYDEKIKELNEDENNKIDQSFISSLSSSSSSFLQPITSTLTHMMTMNHNLHYDTVTLIRRVFKSSSS